MESDRWGRRVALLANIGVVIGIILVIIELKQNTDSAELQAAQSYLTMSHELDFRIVDDPSLIALFLTPEQDRTPADLRRMDRWYFGSLRTWENGYFLYRRGVLDRDLWSGQEAFMRDLLRADAGLRVYCQNNRAYFSSSFMSFVDKLIETK